MSGRMNEDIPKLGNKTEVGNHLSSSPTLYQMERSKTGIKQFLHSRNSVICLSCS